VDALGVDALDVDALGVDALEADALEADALEADALGAGVAGGASSGVLCTGLRGAGDGGAGGAVTAGMEALATGEALAGVPGDPPAAAGWVAVGVTPGGGGGGAVPTPNRFGDAVGDDGSASGADCAACWALVRSATSESVSCFISSWLGGVGLAGTVDMLG
jgi:hypothetical protein